MNDAVTYYTDDVTLLPARTIWRIVFRGLPVMAPPAFAYFYARKILRRRFPASYGAPYPQAIEIVAESEIPTDARASMAPITRACEELGFQTAFHLVPRFIGGKRAASTVLLGGDGYSFATVVWFSVSVGQFTKSKVVFSCHSCLINGCRLHTSTIAAEDRHPELIPPDTHMMCLPVDTPMPKVVDAHRAHTSGHGLGLVRFTHESPR